MSPALASFLTDILRRRAEVVGNDMVSTQQAIVQFYRYLDAIDVEHCNFGGFQMCEDGETTANAFSGSRLPHAFQEEFTEEMAGDDYVMRKAAELTPSQPVSRFDVGLPVLDEIVAFNPASVPIQKECARHGIVEGTALIGDTATWGRKSRGRFYGFVFAGDRGSGNHIRTLMPELELAAFALLDCIGPAIEADIDGLTDRPTLREQDVLRWLAEGLQRQEIAYRMSISIPTVDMHTANLKRKMGATTLAEAVAKGIRYGLI